MSGVSVRVPPSEGDELGWEARADLATMLRADPRLQQHRLLDTGGVTGCLGTRVTVGLVFPLGFAWMTASSLRFKNTRSATGILYASTVLVLIGTGVAVSLQDSYGVPL